MNIKLLSLLEFKERGCLLAQQNRCIQGLKINKNTKTQFVHTIDYLKFSVCTHHAVKFGEEKQSGSSVSSSAVGFGSAFKKAAGDWECPTCLVTNKIDANNCVACQEAKPGATNVPAVSQKSEERPSAGLVTKTSDFGDAFKRDPNEWECETCMVSNKGNTAKCIACATPKQAALDSSKVITGNFKFGVGNDSGSSFTFGVNNAKATSSLQSQKSLNNFEFKAPSGPTSISSSFSFSSTVKSTTGETSSAFSFGVKPTTVNSAGGVNSSNALMAKSPVSPVSSSVSISTSNISSSSANPLLKAGNISDLFKSTKQTAVRKTENISTENVFFESKEKNNTAVNSTSSTANSSKDTQSSLPSFAFGVNKVNSSFPSVNNVDNSQSLRKEASKESSNNLVKKEQNSSIFGGKNNGIAAENNTVAPQFSFTSKFSSNNNADSAQSGLFQFGMNATGNKETTVGFGKTVSPPAFGTSSTISTNNNNNTINDANSKQAGAASPIFSFGEPPDKKHVPTFGGDKLNNTTPTAFNFSSGTPNFQFGQVSCFSYFRVIEVIGQFI